MDNSVTYILREEEEMNERNFKKAFACVWRVHVLATSQLQDSLLILVIITNLPQCNMQADSNHTDFFLSGISGFLNLRLLSKLLELPPPFLQSCQLLCCNFRVNSIVSKF